MALVNFKKGLAGSLPSTHAEGTFYVTTDERAIYLDINDSTRIRLGDFQEYENLTALQAVTNPSTTALYYVKDINCLAKYNGTQFVQINPDKGAIAVEVGGDAGAANGLTATYDETSRKITISMSKAFVTENEVTSKIAAAIGDIDEDTVKEYVDKKTEGIASDDALKTLEGRIQTAESDIDALEAKVGDETVANQISDAIDELELEDTYETKENAASTKSELEEAIGKKQDTVAFQTTYDKDTNKAATMADVTAAVAGLSGAMHWKGEVDTVPDDDEDGTYTAGDVVSVDGIEYAFDGEAWIELGDEASHHTHTNLTTLEKITETTLTDITEAKAKATENASAIAAIKDGAEIESFGDVEDALDEIDAAIDDVKDELIGESGDAKDADTINGAKAFATDAITTALTWGSF